jgi:diguanylate cyclase (GGDEF)-like protein
MLNIWPSAATPVFHDTPMTFDLAPPRGAPPRLYDVSVHDALTHVFNRRYLDGRLLAEISHARRDEADLAVLVIGLDDLERITQHFGHFACDRARCTIATRIQRVLRAPDVLARSGDDEFVALGVGATGAQGKLLAERIRAAVEGLQMSARGRQVRITASIGLASLAEMDSRAAVAAALLSRAEARMHEARTAGRNRTCSAGSTAPKKVAS